MLFRSPVAEPERSYFAGGRRLKMNRPWPSVVVCLVIPVSVLVTVTVPPGSTAWEASRKVPCSRPPEDCANIESGIAASNANTHANLKNFIMNTHLPAGDATAPAKLVGLDNLPRRLPLLLQLQWDTSVKCK